MNIRELSRLLADAKAKRQMIENEDGITFLVTIPFERWEIELRGGRVIRVERFISTRDKLSPMHIHDMLDRIGYSSE